jgi:SOS-response transcriptional repressor LexA
MLTRREADCHAFISQRIEVSGIAPSFREIAYALDLSSTSRVYDLVVQLERKGYLRRLIAKARGLEVLRHVDGTLAANGASAELLRALDRFMLGRISESTLREVWMEYRPPQSRAT